MSSLLMDSINRFGGDVSLVLTEVGIIVLTNLNPELESSTETIINHLRDESNSELPSAIRQNNDSDFSQN